MSARIRKKLKIIWLLTYLFTININFFSYISASEGLEWIKTYGGEGDEVLHSSIKTSDNCLLLVGESNSYSENDYDVYIIKIDQTGTILWSKTFGDEIMNYDDAGHSVRETSDGYLITGKICAYEGVGDDVLLLKTDKNGDKLWMKNYGGNAWDWGNDLILNQDGTIMIVGSTQDFAFAYYDTFLIKTDENGDLLWKRSYKNAGYQYPSSIIQIPNKNYLITGTTTDGTNTESDIFVTKIDFNGNEIWFKKYGGTGREEGVKIIQTSDGYTVIGKTESSGAGRNDIYLMKIDENGNKLWEQTIGSPADEEGQNILQNPDGSILVTGGTFKEPKKSMDIYIAAINPYAELTFEQAYGTSNFDRGIATHQFNENTYYITGYTGNKIHDFVVMKISLKTYNLVINSPIGEVFGTGKYYLGATPILGIKREIVQTDENIRYSFSGWTSSDPGGYTGPDNPVQITIQNEITQTAVWTKQYYVEFQKEGEGEICAASGWYDEGTVLQFNATPVREDEFLEWIGQGLGSYSGRDDSPSIVVNGPILQKAKFGKFPVWTVVIESEYGEVVGSGEYREGNATSFRVNTPIVYISEQERVVFSEWVSPDGSGYSGTSNQASIIVTSDIHQKAVWKKQYYVEIICDNEHAEAPKSGWYYEGEKVSLEVVPENGYQLDCWEIYDGNTVSTFSSNRVMKITESVRATAYIEPIPKPNYSIIIAIGSIVCAPIIVKSWITIESKTKLRGLAKREYNNSRGTIHKKMIQSALPNLQSNIKSLSDTVKNLKKEKTSIIKQKEDETKKTATTYIFDNHFTQIPGIGKKLKDRVHSQIFDGTFDSLYRTSWVEGIGETKNQEIRKWISDQQKRLPDLIQRGFPDKAEIEKRYGVKIKEVERKILSNQNKLEPLEKLEAQALSELNKLNKVDVTTIVKSFNGDSEASNLATEYHLGVFPEWSHMPSWFKELMEKYS